MDNKNILINNNNNNICLYIFIDADHSCWCKYLINLINFRIDLIKFAYTAYSSASLTIKIALLLALAKSRAVFDI